MNGITPDAAADLLKGAQSSRDGARGPAGWPAIAGALGMSAAASVYLAATGGAFEVGSLLIVFAWIAVSIVVAAFGFTRAKAGFGLRWACFMTAWVVIWAVGLAVPGATAAFVAAALLVLAALVYTVVEARS